MGGVRAIRSHDAVPGSLFVAPAALIYINAAFQISARSRCVSAALDLGRGGREGREATVRRAHDHQAVGTDDVREGAGAASEKAARKARTALPKPPCSPASQDSSQDYCHPGTLRMSGSSWAMPLWQSMQVFWPVKRNR
jgi:hypothetical protein